jgi:hypothetical protein
MLRALYLGHPQPLTPTAPGRFEAFEGPLAGLIVSVEREAGQPVALRFEYGAVRGLRLQRVRSG